MIDPALLNLLPPLRRARGDRLYGPDQKHWVDLWKQDGVWLLGHRPEGAATEWKNQVDKGLALWAPSSWPRRLEAQVARLVPAAAVRIFRNVDRAPAADLWRPWDDAPVPGAFGALRLVLPTGPGQAVAVAYGSAWTDPVPESDVTSVAEAASLVYAAAQVARFTLDPRAQAARQKAAAAFDRFVGPSGHFLRRGIWFWAAPGQDYSALFRRHLAAGFLLNPDPEGAGVIPVDLSPGEWSAWGGL